MKSLRAELLDRRELAAVRLQASRKLSTGSLATYAKDKSSGTSNTGSTYRDIGVFFMLTIFLASSVGSAIFFKKTTNAKPNDAFVIMQMTVFVACFVYFIVGRVRACFSRGDTQVSNSTGARTPSWSMLALIGLMDCIAFCLVVVGGIYTKGTTQVLLLQISVPLTIVILYCSQRKRLGFMQVVGSLVILVAMYLVVSDSSSLQSDDSLASPANPLLFNFIFILSTVPACVAGYLKHSALAGIKDDAVILTAYSWKSLFQLVFGFLLVPFSMWTNAVSLPQGVIHSLDLSTSAPCTGALGLLQVISCRVSDTVIQPTRLLHYLPPCPDCTDSGESMPLFILFSLVQAFTALLLFREASPLLVAVTSVVRIPFVTVCFSVIPNETFRWRELPGLLVMVVGVAVMRLQYSPDSSLFCSPFVWASPPNLGPGMYETFTCQITRQAEEPVLPTDRSQSSKRTAGPSGEPTSSRALLDSVKGKNTRKSGAIDVRYGSFSRSTMQQGQSTLSPLAKTMHVSPQSPLLASMLPE